MLPLLVIAIALLALVLVPGLGVSINGSRRWLRLGPLSFQPAELAKLALVVYLAAFLARKQEAAAHGWRGVVPPLAVSAWLAALGTFFADRLPVPVAILESINFVISFCVLTFLFGAIFKALPDVYVAWRDVILGAALTSLLFTLGKVVIGFYLGRASIGSAYGAAGSLVIILLWVYYSAQILFFGAEFTKVWARRRGAGAMPTEDAVPVTEEARAEQGMTRRRSMT